LKQIFYLRGAVKSKVMSEATVNPRIMIHRALCAIAGVDRETLAACPPSDKLWATHLGFSLILSFVVVFGISYHATSYVIDSSIIRFVAALVIALTVFMFDRALYQSDWFSQGLLSGGQALPELSGHRSPAFWRFVRIFVRLVISFALAWIIALFLELAIFSDTITDQIIRDHVTANQATYQKIESYERGLDEDIVSRRKSLAGLERLNTENIAGPTTSSRGLPVVTDQFEQQLLALDKQEQDIRVAIRELNAEVTRYAEEMNAEERGQRLKPTQSGRAGIGPRYQFAKQQRDVFLEQRAEREKELAALQSRREEVRSNQANMRAEALARDTQDREVVARRRHNLQAEVDAARRELQAREASRSAKIDAFTKAAFVSSGFQKQKNDPLSRMTAYQQLHNDPKDGATITLFSWMTKVLVIFLEIVPVVAKIFFSPPSVYGALIQARVARERAKVRRESLQETSSDNLGVVPHELFEAPPQRPALRKQLAPELREQPAHGMRHTSEARSQPEGAVFGIQQVGIQNGEPPKPAEFAEPSQPRPWSGIVKESNETSTHRGSLPVISDEAAAFTNVVPSSLAVTKPWAEALHTIINKSRSAPRGERAGGDDLTLVKSRSKGPPLKSEKSRK